MIIAPSSVNSVFAGQDRESVAADAEDAPHALETLRQPLGRQAQDRIAARIFAQRGARSAPALVYGFPGTVLISVNDEIVHGVPGSRRLESGDLVKLDVTVEKDRYVADAARTVIVDASASISSMPTSRSSDTATAPAIV